MAVQPGHAEGSQSVDAACNPVAGDGGQARATADAAQAASVELWVFPAAAAEDWRSATRDQPDFPVPPPSNPSITAS